MHTSSYHNEGLGWGGLNLSSAIFGQRFVSRSTLFRSDEYIERLNQQLRLELGVLHTYSRLNSRTLELQIDQLLTIELTTAHQKACRELSRMIISHKGLPDNSPARILKVTGSVIELCTQWPFGHRLVTYPLANIEQVLTHRYQSLVHVAPECDKHNLIELKRLTRKNRAHLKLMMDQN